MTDTRTEQDFLGQRALPKDALYGINTQRAMENFALGQKHTELSLIHAMVQVKTPVKEYLERVFKSGVTHHCIVGVSDMAQELLEVANLLGLETFYIE